LNTFYEIENTSRFPRHKPFRPKSLDLSHGHLPQPQGPETVTLRRQKAFRKFKSRLELNEREQQNASYRQKEVREYLDEKFEIETSFLTGSYSRNTKTKPLKDIDIFFVMKESQREVYRTKSPSIILNDFYDKLVEKYGRDAVRKQDKSVNVNFGVVADAEDNTDYRILSVDAVPAFSCADNYEIPNESTRAWIKTNPKVHAAKAVAAHQAYSNEWKGLVRMMKYWNNNAKHGDKPVKPSFLIEVMALECLHGGWQGSFEYEIQGFFATLASRIFDTWNDPAQLGPPISNAMDETKKKRAKELLEKAMQEVSLAINHTRQGRNGEALRAWRELFGPKFPLS